MAVDTCVDEWMGALPVNLFLPTPVCEYTADSPLARAISLLEDARKLVALPSKSCSASEIYYNV